MHWAWLLLPLFFAGCLGDQTVVAGQECHPPSGAGRSVAPYDNGVALYSMRQGTHIDAWACNEGDDDRWLLPHFDGCPGSWTWTYQPPGAAVPTAQWPPETNYHSCWDQLERISPGRGQTTTMTLSVAPETGAEWRIRLQVLTQPYELKGTGGGPVHAVYTF